MNYIEWNNAIAKFFFNEKKSEKEVFLFITKNDISKIGKSVGLSGNNDEVFENYIQAIRSDLKKWFRLPLIKRPLQWYKKWDQDFDKKSEFPPYIGYLVSFILPLTSSKNTKYNANNFYGRLNDFLEEYTLIEHENIGTPQFKKLDILWRDLENWSILTKNTELGYFELHPFTHKEWVYVGKPLSQAIFPVTAINNLHDLYDRLGLVPGGKLKEEKVREIVKKYGEQKLNLESKTVDLIQKPENEIGLSIVKLIQRNYERWEGINEELITDEKEPSFIVSELRLCFEIDKVNESIQHYYRLYSTNEYPENLNFGGKLPVKYKANNWSDIIQLPFNEKSEFIDRHNKWKARINDKTIRFFVNGKMFHLSGWVEVPNYVPNVKNIVLVKNENREEFKDWKDDFEPKDFSEIEYENAFLKYSLFEFENPKNRHPNFDEISNVSNKKIEFVGGLKLKPNTYFAEVLPFVNIAEEYKNEIRLLDEKNRIVELKKVNDTPFLKLPDKLTKSSRLKFCEGEDKDRPLKNLFIVKKEDYSDAIVPYRTPPIDNNGRIIIKGDQQEPEKDSTVNEIGTIKYSYKPLKKGAVSYSKYERVDYAKNYINDLLLYFLTYKRELITGEFNKAFEELLLNKNNADRDLEIQKSRRLSLRMYYNLGHVEILYSKRKVFTYKPKLILIPTETGRKALLIGGRSNALVSNLFNESESLGLSMNVTPHSTSQDHFVLPNKIELQAGGTFDGEKKLKRAAINCGIAFESDLLFHYNSISNCADIFDYENELVPKENFVDKGYKARIFNVDLLKFRDSKVKEIDKNLSLVEYKVNEYTYRIIYWLEQIPYEVDRDWGRFLLLKKLKKQVVFFTDKKNTVTILIPTSVVLPRLFDRALATIDGYIPESKLLEIREFKTYFKVYKSIPLQIARELCRKLAQPERSVKIKIDL